MLAAKIHHRRRHALMPSEYVTCTLAGIRASVFASKSSTNCSTRRLNGGLAGARVNNVEAEGRNVKCCHYRYPMSSSYFRHCQLQHPVIGSYTVLPINHNSYRSFSKFSTDSSEAVAQDSDSSRTTPQQLPSNTSPSTNSSTVPKEETAATKPSIDYLKPDTNKMKQLLSLKEAYITLSKTHIEAAALLKNNLNATSSDELVAMADYFLILVNSVELETSIETIQKLQYEKELVDGDSVTKEVLDQALKAMFRLHNVFLRVVESLVPPAANNDFTSEIENLPSSTFVDSLELSKYSAMTMGRALQVSRRAEELGMPMHKPLYQRMALGIVHTSPKPLPVDPGQWPWDRDQTTNESTDKVGESTLDNKAPTKLVLPGEFEQVIEGINTTHLPMELLNLGHRAKVALRCSFSPSMSLNEQIEQSRQQHQLERDMYSDAWLQMLKRRQFEDAIGLLRGWDSDLTVNKGKSSITLLELVGEETVLKALEIAKDWVVGTSFHSEVSSNSHANEVIELLQHSLAIILKRRKSEAGRLANLVTALAALQATAGSESEDDDFSDDSDESDDSDFEEDFEDEFDSDNDGDEYDEELDKIDDLTSENFPMLLKGIGFDNVEVKDDTVDQETSSNAIEINLNFEDVNSPETAIDATPTTTSVKEEEPLLIEGYTNKEIRRSIYMRKGPKWELPDIVPQLTDWNKGKELAFTPEYERHLAWEMAKEDDDNT